MLSRLLTAAMALAVIAALPTSAFAQTASTATVDVEIGDILLLSDISGGLTAAQASDLADYWNGVTKAGTGTAGSISADGEDLLVNRAGLSGFGDGTGTATYSVRTNATRNFVLEDSDSGTNPGNYVNESLTTVADITGNSVFDGDNDGPLIGDAFGGGGDFFANGFAEISNIFHAEVTSDVSATPVGNQADALANAINSTINVGLNPALTGSFDVELYIDVIMATIDLVAIGAGSQAEAEFALTATISGVRISDGVQVVLGTASFADNDLATSNTSVSRDVTANGPSTGGGSGTATPFATATVDTAIYDTLVLNIALTSSAQVFAGDESTIPEPTSLALFGIGGIGIIVARRRARRRTQLTA